MRYVGFLLVMMVLGAAFAVPQDHFHRQAERAMLHQDYVTARSLFRKLLCGKNDADLIIRLATAEQHLGNLEEAKRLLETIDMTNLDSNHRLEGQILLARLYHRSGLLDQAVLLLCELDREVSRKKWKREDRAFFTGLLICVSDRYRSLLQQAEQCVESGFYEEASPLYQRVLDAVLVGELPLGSSKRATITNLRLRLAEVAYQQKQYKDAIQWLLPLRDELLKNQGLTPTADGYQPLFLLGLSQIKCDQIQHALKSFRTYLSFCSPQAPKRNEALWYTGLCLFLRGELDTASETFVQLTQEGSSSEYTLLAQIYLARIDIKNRAFYDAKDRLVQLSKILQTQNPLQLEVAYLQGEAALGQGQYKEALSYFERAIPARNADKSKWSIPARYGLAESYLKLKEYTSAEKTFQRLMASHGGDRATLGLARTYLGKGAYAQVEALFEKMPLTSRAGEAEALLLLAKAQPTFEEREAIYQRLCNPTYHDTPSYGLGWLAWGIDQFEHENDEAPATLKAAFIILEHDNPTQAALALKMRGQTFYQKKDYTNCLATLVQLTKSSTFDHLAEKDEIYYLMGLAGADPSYLNRVMLEYPDGAFAAPAIHALATLNHQEGNTYVAKTLFLRLAENHPSSSLAGDAWFFASLCAQEREEAKSYRCKVFELYPHSTYAAESYFLLYLFSEYMRDDLLALKHLQQMPEQFPKSPFTMVAHYLLGLRQKEHHPDEAVDHFSQVKRLFELSDIPNDRQEYFTTIHHRALLELALTSEELPVVQEALECILSESPSEKISEEAEFLLAKTLLRQGNLKLAEEAFTSITLQHGGYYASRAWQEMGRISMQQRAYHEALNCFAKVKEPLLSTDQKLELQILRSSCYRDLGDFDQAMLLLSRVINGDAASSRRVEAMYLRALIYERQGRHELAFRQLEATTKKGGEWSHLAEEKLREDYGFF